TEKDRYVPSVDRMMISAKKCYKKRALGIILTGMGNDGTEGMKGIKSAGGYTIAESEETAIVYGMPQEAVKAGVIDKVLSIDIVASEIRGVLMGERRR
ncbi:CheB methylesterase domain-containing protein, partial [Nitrospirota bacterium]